MRNWRCLKVARLSRGCTPIIHDSSLHSYIQYSQLRSLIILRIHSPLWTRVYLPTASLTSTRPQTEMKDNPDMNLPFFCRLSRPGLALEVSSQNYFYYLFFHRRPTNKLCFLSSRPFVVNATFLTGLVYDLNSEINSPDQATKEISKPNN